MLPPHRLWRGSTRVDADGQRAHSSTLVHANVLDRPVSGKTGPLTFEEKLDELHHAWLLLAQVESRLMRVIEGASDPHDADPAQEAFEEVQRANQRLKAYADRLNPLL